MTTRILHFFFLILLSLLISNIPHLSSAASNTSSQSSTTVYNTPIASTTTPHECESHEKNASDLTTSQKKAYERDIQQMIQSTEEEKMCHMHCQSICDDQLRTQGTYASIITGFASTQQLVLAHLPPWLVEMWTILEGLLSPYLILLILGCSIVFMFLFVVPSIVTSVGWGRCTNRKYYVSPEDPQKEDILLDSVTYYISSKSNVITSNETHNHKQSKRSADNSTLTESVILPNERESSKHPTNQQDGRLFSSPQIRDTQLPFISPQSSMGDNFLYEKISPITPSKSVYEGCGGHGRMYSNYRDHRRGCFHASLRSPYSESSRGMQSKDVSASETSINIYAD